MALTESEELELLELEAAQASRVPFKSGVQKVMEPINKGILSTLVSAGRSVPGTDLMSALIQSSIEGTKQNVGALKSGGKPYNILEDFPKQYDRVKRIGESVENESPVGKMLGKIAGSSTTFKGFRDLLPAGTGGWINETAKSALANILSGQSQELNPNKITSQAAWGAGPEALSQGIKNSDKILEWLGRNLMGTVIKTPLEAGKKGKDYAQTALDMGLRGGYSKMGRQLDTAENALETQLQHELAGVTDPIKRADIIRRANESRGLFDVEGGGAQLQAFDDVIDDFAKRGTVASRGTVVGPRRVPGEEIVETSPGSVVGPRRVSGQPIMDDVRGSVVGPSRSEIKPPQGWVANYDPATGQKVGYINPETGEKILLEDILQGSSKVVGQGGKVPTGEYASDTFEGGTSVIGAGTKIPTGTFADDTFQGGTNVIGSGQTQLFDDLGQSLTKDLTASQANIFKRKLGRFLGSRFFKGDQSQIAPGTKEGQEALRGALQAAIEDVAPNAKPINQQIGNVISLADEVSRGGAASLNTKMPSLTKVIGSLGVGGMSGFGKDKDGMTFDPGRALSVALLAALGSQIAGNPAAATHGAQTLKSLSGAVKSAPDWMRYLGPAGYSLTK